MLDEYRAVAEVVFLLGGVVWIMRWIGRTLIEVSGGRPKERGDSETRLKELFLQTGAANYLTVQRADSAPIPAGTTQSLPHAGRTTGVAVRLHCPMCGEPLSAVPVPLPFAVECPGCHRRLNARGDGPQRMSIGVVEPRRTIVS